MSERNLTPELMNRIQEIHREWADEVEQYFDAHKDEKVSCNQLDGPRTWGLVKIEQKYKKKINDELGIAYYKDVDEVAKSGHRKFSDLIIKNPNGFPDLPGRK